MACTFLLFSFCVVDCTSLVRTCVSRFDTQYNAALFFYFFYSPPFPFSTVILSLANDTIASCCVHRVIMEEDGSLHSHMPPSSFSNSQSRSTFGADKRKDEGKPSCLCHRCVHWHHLSPYIKAFFSTRHG